MTHSKASSECEIYWLCKETGYSLTIRCVLSVPFSPVNVLLIDLVVIATVNL